MRQSVQTDQRTSAHALRHQAAYRTRMRRTGTPLIDGSPVTHQLPEGLLNLSCQAAGHQYAAAQRIGLYSPGHSLPATWATPASRVAKHRISSGARITTRVQITTTPPKAGKHPQMTGRARQASARMTNASAAHWTRTTRVVAAASATREWLSCLRTQGRPFAGAHVV